MKKIIILLFNIILCWNVFSQKEIRNGVVIDHTAEKIVNNVVSRLKADSPLSFNFNYTITKGRKQIDKDKGSFLSFNDKYRVCCSSFNDYCNGKTLYHYVKSSNEVEVSDIEDGNSMFNFIKIINQYSKTYRSKLIKVDNVNNVACNVIDLVPMKKSNISRVRIYSNRTNNRLLKMIIYIIEGNTYTYSFSAYKAKTRTTVNDFTFPKNKFPKVKIVDLR
jgi:outer membrane lipoprotein-sorting protein